MLVQIFHYDEPIVQAVLCRNRQVMKTIVHTCACLGKDPCQMCENHIELTFLLRCRLGVLWPVRVGLVSTLVVALLAVWRVLAESYRHRGAPGRGKGGGVLKLLL